jgi:hypothetical protein
MNENIEITLQNYDDRLLQVAYVVKGLSLDNLAVYLHKFYPNSPGVEAFYQQYETVSQPELTQLLAAVAGRVTVIDAIRMVVKQHQWENHSAGHPDPES